MFIHLQLNMRHLAIFIFGSIHLYLPLKISDNCQLNFQKKPICTGTS